MINHHTAALRGRSAGDWHSNPHHQHLEIGDNISNAISSVSKDYLLMIEYD